jgi:hypothetical protein
MKTAREIVVLCAGLAHEAGFHELSLSITQEVNTLDEEHGSHEWGKQILATEVLDEAEKTAFSMLYGTSKNKSDEKRKISRFVSELKTKLGRFSGLQEGYC